MLHLQTKLNISRIKKIASDEFILPIWTRLLNKHICQPNLYSFTSAEYISKVKLTQLSLPKGLHPNLNQYITPLVQNK